MDCGVKSQLEVTVSGLEINPVYNGSQKGMGFGVTAGEGRWRGISELRRRMGCWGKSGSGLPYSKKHRAFWSAVALHPFWGIAGTTDLQNSHNSEMRPAGRKCLPMSIRGAGWS